MSKKKTPANKRELNGILRFDLLPRYFGVIRACRAVVLRQQDEGG